MKFSIGIKPGDYVRHKNKTKEGEVTHVSANTATFRVIFEHDGLMVTHLVTCHKKNLRKVFILSREVKRLRERYKEKMSKLLP